MRSPRVVRRLGRRLRPPRRLLPLRPQWRLALLLNRVNSDRLPAPARPRRVKRCRNPGCAGAASARIEGWLNRPRSRAFKAKGHARHGLMVAVKEMKAIATEALDVGASRLCPSSSWAGRGSWCAALGRDGVAVCTADITARRVWAGIQEDIVDCTGADRRLVASS